MGDNTQRLDKVLANSGFGTRKDVKRLIRHGDILVNGEPVSSPEMHVDIEHDTIVVEGNVLQVEKNAYFMMNKAGGAVCSTKSDRRKTVFEFLDDEDNRKYLGGYLSTVGRLDADTEGLLILTSDGNLIHRVTFPKYEVPKTYLVYLRDSVNDENRKYYEEELAKGVHIAADGKDGEADCRPAKIQWKNKTDYKDLEAKEGEDVCTLTVTEGKFHEVKRIFAALGNEVMYLKRLQMNRLFLDESLAPGQYRPLTDEEIKLLDVE